MSPSMKVVVTTEPHTLSRELVRGHLYLSLAMETDGAYIAAEADDLATAGMPEDDVFGLAMSLLRQSTARADVLPVDTMPGLHLLVAEDGLAASRMVIVPELIGPTRGGVVVAVPAPDQLLIVPLNSAAAIDALHVLASALSYARDASDSPLSDQLFWFDGARWIPLPVVHGESEVTVLPPLAFVDTMNRLAAMDMVRVVGEA